VARRNRANGEGTIRFDARDRRWHGWIDMGTTEGGRRDRRHVANPERAVVVKALRELATKRDAGVVPAAGRAPTLAEWAEYYLENVARHRVRPSTLQSYRWLFDRHILPVIGHHRLDRLQPEHVELVHRRMLDQQLSPSSVLHAHRVLSRCLKVAWQRGRVARNVAQMVDAPAQHPKEIEPLSRREARAILDTAADRRNAARWSVALALGLRQGEALGLQWRDVDLDQGTLVVRQALQRRIAEHGCGGTCGAKRAADCPQRIGGGLVLVQPKSRASRRTVSLPPPLVDALRVHRAWQNRERLTAGTEWVDCDLLFARENGTAIDPKEDFRAWKQLLTDAGVRDARLHDARHTAATIMLTMGVPARVVMQVLGHSQITLTLGTYSHVAPELAAEAAERVGRALWD
jgi:integrase